jgi:tetratricopeptide (TPR) repeat protein
MKNILTIILLLSSSWVFADQNDPRLPELFEELKAAENAMEAGMIEIRIWDIWGEHSDPEIADMMFFAMDELSGNQYDLAVQSFTEIIERDPDFSEAWNMRATTHFLLGNYRESESDIMRTLELEPKHFGALSGLGQVYVEMEQYYDARNALRRALQVNPTMPGVIANLEALQRFFNATAI